MYSLVMMAAFTTGADATPAPAVYAAQVVSGCCGYSVGCCGYSYSTGCCGYSYGCCGYSYGCYGGGWVSGRKWHGHKHGCVSYGCCGFDYGPVGYSYGGCCGWSTSCFGCCGGCYGSWSYGCGSLPAYGVYNIGGGGVIYSTPSMSAPVVVPPSATPVPPPAADKKDAANIKFVLPPNAKLYVDGQPTTGAGDVRAFYTPSLEQGRKFYYEVKAELEVNGEKVIEEKRVIVQAGDELRESFPKLIAAAARTPDVTLATK